VLESKASTTGRDGCSEKRTAANKGKTEKKGVQIIKHGLQHARFSLGVSYKEASAQYGRAIQAKGRKK
jgi:hypothetical protein